MGVQIGRFRKSENHCVRTFRIDASVAEFINSCFIWDPVDFGDKALSVSCLQALTSQTVGVKAERAVGLLGEHLGEFLPHEVFWSDAG